MMETSFYLYVGMKKLSWDALSRNRFFFFLLTILKNVLVAFRNEINGIFVLGMVFFFRQYSTFHKPFWTVFLTIILQALFAVLRLNFKKIYFASEIIFC